MYKPTPFRQIVFHTGPVIFEGIVGDDHLQHFLLLHASLRIVASVSPSKHKLYYAEKALHLFVSQCTNLYGEKFSSYNIHCLLHLVEDVKLLGPIDGYSAFPYENNMKIFRGYCRKPDHSLQQIANRRAEQAKWIEKARPSFDTPVALNQHSEGHLPANILQGINLRVKQYRRVRCKRFDLATTKRDSCFITKGGSVVVVCNIIVLDDEILLVASKFARVTSFYDIAIPSSSVGCYKCSELEGDLVLVRFGDIANKGYRMPHWSPRQYGDGGQQILAEGEFIVTSMACDAYY